MIKLIKKEFSKEILESLDIIGWWLNHGTERKNLDFQHVSIWGLPMHYCTKEMRRKIGSIMGSLGYVEKSESYEYLEKNFKV